MITDYALYHQISFSLIIIYYYEFQYIYYVFHVCPLAYSPPHLG